MKTAQMIAAALILATSVSTMAQQTTDTTTHAATTTADSKEIVRGKTRAEVIAELQQAEAAGKGVPTGFVAYDAPAKSNAAPSNTQVARK